MKYFCILVAISFSHFSISFAAETPSETRSEQTITTDPSLDYSHRASFHTFALQLSPQGLNESQYNHYDQWNIIKAQYGIIPIQFAGEWEIAIEAQSAFYGQSQSAQILPPTQIYNIAFGPQIQYRGKYFSQQPVIPVLNSSWNYQVSKDRAVASLLTDSFFQAGAGLWLYLNIFDRKSAGSLRAELGIKNTYLTFDYVQTIQTGNRTEIKNYLLGLRFEI